ncbi:hypothetical protein B296_00051047 [Ensete ventricosum]|uniref:Uncharacterized protein n=1 Tax=Ensete ventricosum TaxID=4639 RepID=A0A426XB28_ENSVE|nr:hypothetical protein B296_00051047 [Ensete ventricosum]
MSRHCWFWPVCASSPTIVSSGEVEHDWEEGVLWSNPAGRTTDGWSSGRESAPSAWVGRSYNRWLLHACARSAPLYRVGHAGDLVVQGRGDVVARSIFVISFARSIFARSRAEP